MIDLSHWKLIRNLTAQEAGLLISGVDPYNKKVGPAEIARGLVFERAIREAVERASYFAWTYVRGKTKFDEPYCVDIWENEIDFFQYLPSLEMRESVTDVLRDPTNVPILIPVDPWFSATVFAGDLTIWLEGNEIESAFEFDGVQRVSVTPLEKNWYSKSIAIEKTEAVKLGVSMNADSVGDRSLGMVKGPPTPDEWRARVSDSVKRNAGNKTKAAAELGISRQRVSQLLAKGVNSEKERKGAAPLPQDPFGLLKKIKNK